MVGGKRKQKRARRSGDSGSHDFAMSILLFSPGVSVE